MNRHFRKYHCWLTRGPKALVAGCWLPLSPAGGAVTVAMSADFAFRCCCCVPVSYYCLARAGMRWLC
uniref:Putative secreted protein n=1 Tax=Anopheles darlingi TaxID=43151 RepID=A0A2M4DAU4_ANODA